MSTKREFLKGLVGLAVAPLVPVPEVVEAVETHDLELFDSAKDINSLLAAWLSEQRQREIEAAMLQGYEGPWTFEYRLLPNDTRRVLLDGKGVACG